jgi:RimJ/RimL family protein N-acetyltransferase
MDGNGAAMTSEVPTDRLRLRASRYTDREPFAVLNGDPRVMEYFPSTLSREQSHVLMDHIEAHLDRHGFGLWAVEVPSVAPFEGVIGLCVPPFETHFTPFVEIGWRLSGEHWDRGYATEGAQAALRFGFETLELEQIVAFTVPGNLRSRRVMEKVGMAYNPADDFDHPLLSEGHPLRRHVLYRVNNPALPNKRLQPAAAGARMSRRG